MIVTTSGLPTEGVVNVAVEIAWEAGYATPAVDRVWTDVSEWVELAENIEITRGRGDEFATCDANTLRLVFDNSDGRFTAYNAGGAYYPNVKVGRPIRVTVTDRDQVDHVRFLGYVDEWPVEWDGTDSYAKAAVTASSRLARLGSDRELRSIIEEEILLDDPLFYYLLSEPEDATSAADSSGNDQSALVQKGSGAAVVFGSATGPGTDSLTAAAFAGEKYLEATVPVSSGNTSARWLSCFFSTTGAVSTSLVIWSTNSLLLTSSGQVRGNIGGVQITSPLAYNDGATHHALVKGVVGGSTELYVDGALVASGSAPTLYAGSAYPFIGTGSSVAATIAHVALGTSDIAAARVAEHADAGITGFQGETVADRIARYAGYVALPADEIDSDTGTPPMAHVDPAGSTAIDMIRLVESTEGGVLFDAKDGTLAFRERSNRYTAAVEFTVDMEAQQVEATFAPKVDRSALLNDVTAALSDETVTARAVDRDSVADYGRKTLDLELATTDATEPSAAAWWRVNTYGEPTVRVPNVGIDLLPLSNELLATVLDADIGSRFQVTNIPSQAAESTGDYFVEGYTETIGLASYLVSFNVSDAAPYVSVWFLGDSEQSQLDSTTKLAY